MTAHDAEQDAEFHEADFDVVVIGSGPVGENAAGRCADGGLSVAIVERELVGGECSFWACIPSKTLLRPGDVLAAARRVPGAAEAITGKIDAAAVFAWRDENVSDYRDAGGVPWVTDKGIELVRGAGRLDGERTVVVAAHDGTMHRLRARVAVVLATGSTAAVPPIPGLAEVDPWDNRGATSAAAVPRRLLVLGGGPVGVELAQAFRRLGSDQVTLVASGRLLAREEPFAADDLRAAFEAEGITVLTDTHAVGAHRSELGEVVLTLEDRTHLVADRLLVATGRRPATADLGLETLGLTAGEPVEVDDQFRAVGVLGGWLYAVGDVNGRAPLTHMGKYQARLVGDVILGRTAADGSPIADLADYRSLVRVTFTDPQVAAVGLTERQAREAGLPIRVVTTPTGGVAGAHVLGRGITGTSQLVVDTERRVIVGATFTGPDVDGLLHAATVAIAGDVTLDQLWHAVPAFPSLSEVWLRLLEAYGL